MNYRLNRKSLQRLRALIRAGQYVDRAWSFTPADSNTLLGTPPNWTEFQLWNLGVGIGVPVDGSTDPTDEKRRKDDFAYPFGKGDVASLAALRSIVKSASAAGENDIADAASDCLAEAVEKIADEGKSKSCDVDISFAAPVTLKAAAGKGPPTFHAVCYTGVAMTLEGFQHPVVIDYAGADFTDKSRPVLRDHDPKRPIGNTDKIGVVGGNIEADGTLGFRSADAYEVVNSKDFPWQISVGAKVLKSEFVPEGQTASANGRTWSGPLVIARATSLREISFLTLGADDNTSARIAAKAAKGRPMKAKLKKKFAAWAKARNVTMADMEDDGMMSAWKAAYKAQMKCEPDDADDEDADDEDMKDDDKKKKDADADSAAQALEIRAAAAGGSNDATKGLRAAYLVERQRLGQTSALLDKYRPEIVPEKFGDIEAKAISGVWSLEKTELECIRARRPDRTAPNINTGAGGLGTSASDGMIIAAAAARTNGVSEKAAMQGLDQRQQNIAASMRGLTLHGILAMSAQRLGMHVSPGGIDRDFLDRFIPRDKDSHRQQIEAAISGGMIRASSSAGFSTVSLTGITENILYKAMLEAYSLQATVVPDICYERDVNDFKPFKVYRLTASGDFSPIGPGGELQNMGLQDESYANQVTTRGVLLVLKREDIINDDMGALMQAPQVLGRKAALNREKTVLTAFLSGLSTIAPGASIGTTANSFNFWSTGANNYQSGGTSALSITSVTIARQKFLQQVDANKDPIGVMPDRLLISPEQETVADNLFSGANLTVQALMTPASSSGTSAAQTGSQVPNLNAHRGKYRPVVSPYLGGGAAASQIPGASATAWAMLCSPTGGMATVQVGYLRGQRTPIIRQVESDAKFLGITYQAIYDFGVSLLDYRCGQYSAGA